MNKTAQLPAWHLHRADEALTASGLAEDDYAVAMAIIRYSLPALTRPDLAAAVHRYSIDHDTVLDREFVTRLLDIPQWPASRCTTRGTQFPVAFAMEEPHLLNRPGNAAKFARQLLSEICSPIVPNAKPSLYREQTRDIRDVLVSVVVNLSLHGITPQDWDSVHRAMGSPGMSAIRLVLAERYRTLYELVENRRRLGVHVRNTASAHGSSGRRSSHPRELNTHQCHRRDQIADARPSPTVRQQASNDDPARGTVTRHGLPSEMAALGYRLTSPRMAAQSGAGDDETPAPMLERTRPSLLTPSDDRRAARRIASVAATDTLATQEDLQRLTPWQVHQTLALELPPTAHALVRLLLVTGMPVNRWITLMRQRDTPGDRPTPDNTVPLWDSGRGLLHYRLLDGPSQQLSGSEENCWVTLSLPDVLQETLRAADSDHPLSDSATVLNRHLRKKFRSASGIQPTANRLRATAWLLMRSLTEDNHTVQTLQGQYGVLDAAPAAYRAVPRRHLQAIFDAGMQRCGVPVEPPERHPSSATRGDMGSGRALTSQTAQTWFEALRDAMWQASTPLQMWLRVDPLPVAALVEYTNLAAAYTYLGWLVGTGARPVSVNTKVHISGSLGWLRDKNSRRGLESRVIPVPAPVVEQIGVHRQLINAATSLLDKHGYQIDDQRRDDQQWPTWLTMSRHRQARFTLRALHHGDFRTLLCRVLDVDDLAFPDNATRHCFTTALNGCLEESSLDALVGHARIGRDRCHPRSMANLADWSTNRTAMESLLKKMGFQSTIQEPLPWT